MSKDKWLSPNLQIINHDFSVAQEIHKNAPHAFYRPKYHKKKQGLLKCYIINNICNKFILLFDKKRVILHLK